MIKNMKNELGKIFGGYSFYLCVVMVFGICLFTDVCENSFGKRYSVIEAIMTLPREELISNWQLCSREVIQRGVSGWLSFFLPIVVAFPCIPLLCDEYQTKFVKYEIIRCKKQSFHFTKLLASFFCGAVAVTVGYAMFVAFAYFAFPHPLEMSPEDLQIYQIVAGGSMEDLYGFPFFLLIVKILCCAFAWGGLNALPAIVLSGITKNKYLVMCIPFFVKYALGQVCQKMWQTAAFANGDGRVWMVEAGTIAYPDAVLRLYQYSRDFQWKILIFDALVILLFAGSYFIIQSRRLDCSE